MQMPTSTCFVCNKLFTKREVQLYGYNDCCVSCTYAQATEMEQKRVNPYWVDLYFEAGIPIRYQHVFASELSDKATQRAIKAIAEQKALYLCGNVETGKTLTLAIYAMQLIRFNKKVQFARLSNLTNELRNDPAKQSSTYKKLCECDHLILDDLGTQYDGTGWFTGWLDAVVDFRYSNLKPISASTNVPEQVSARVSRRLTEVCENIKVS